MAVDLFATETPWQTRQLHVGGPEGPTRSSSGHSQGTRKSKTIRSAFFFPTLTTNPRWRPQRCTDITTDLLSLRVLGRNTFAIVLCTSSLAEYRAAGGRLDGAACSMFVQRDKILSRHASTRVCWTDTAPELSSRIFERQKQGDPPHFQCN